MDGVILYSLSAAAGSSDDTFIVWYDARSGDRDIYAQRLYANGNRSWATDVRVNSDSGTASQSSPAVVADVGGSGLVVGGDERNGGGDIYAQKL